LREAATSSLIGGGEEALFETVGQLVLKGGPKALNAIATATGIKPKAIAAFNDLKKALEPRGGTVTLGMATDNFVYQLMEDISRGAIIGGSRLSAVDVANKEALGQYKKDFLEDYSRVATENLQPDAIGRMVQDLLEQGETAFHLSAEQVFKSVDNVVPDIQRVVPVTGESQILDASGKPFILTGEQTLSVGPVKTARIRRTAKQILSKLEKVKNIGKGQFTGDLLNKIAALDQDISFASAQFLRSNLLRDIRRIDTAGEAVDAGTLKRFSKQIDAAMESAGNKLDPEGFQAWRNANEFWKEGAQTFNDDLVVRLVRDNKEASTIIGQVFQPGKVERVRNVRRAISRSIKETGEGNFDETWRQVQGGYMKSLLNVSQEAGKETRIWRILKDPNVADTFNEVFSKEQRREVNKLMSVVKGVENDAVLGTVRNRQFGALAGLLIAGGGIATVSPEAAATVLAVPALFARISTSPKIVNLLTRTLKPTSPKAGRIAAARVIGEIRQILVEDDALAEQVFQEMGIQRGRQVQ